MMNHHKPNQILQNFHFDDVIAIENAQSVSDIFDQMAERASRMIGFSETLLKQRLNTQKNQESAAIGEGIAIPHLQVHGLRAPITLLGRLEQPMAFDNMPDKRAVDLICLILSPKRIGPMHLLRLSQITRMIKDKGVADLMRETSNSRVLLNVLNNPDGWVLAA